MAVFMQTQKKSGVTGWIDTYYYVVMSLSNFIDIDKWEGHPVYEIYDHLGHKGLQMEAMLITNAFEKQYAFQNWDELDYWETIDNFVENWFK
jgi:hypothetical protein